MQHPIVGLLPARNAAEDVPGWLESAGAVCDAVVALDDGSTDATAELLEASPLVKVLLRSPRRDSFAGWHDGKNRNRLLAAAGDLDPGWIVSLDADERLAPDDARALREFLLSGDALPGCAFGLQHYRVFADGRYDPEVSWVYRVFAHRAGQAFPDEPLHFNPVPTDIPDAAWVRTTIRLQHLCSATAQRREQRLAKYAEADPSAEHPRDYRALSEPPGSDLRPWPPRPRDLAVLALGGSRPAAEPAPEQAEQAGQGGDGPTLLCLLPARNCAADLPAYLESVAGFVDGVVAIDDGSTDETGEVLAGHPLVEILLTNPRRDSYAGWDDAANRNRLLEAAAALRPRWVLSLDADERMDPEDGAALRQFVEQEADPARAYGFRVFRMLGADSYDQSSLWVYRLFAYAHGQAFPSERLHFVPIPTAIPRESWAKTTVRIQHFAGVSETRRKARFEKYAQADPGNVFQRDYTGLLTPPGETRSWQRRPPAFPVLTDPARLGPAHELELEKLDLAGPVLSAIVISRNDEDRIERSVRSVAEQRCSQPFEVIVVTSGTDRTAAIVRERFPEVKLVELPRPALPGEARNAGVRVARGDYVSFPGSHTELPQGSLEARLGAHERGFAMITGSILNGNTTPAGWANYFLDHSSALPGRPSGRLDGPPAHCSYIRELVLSAGSFPEDMRAGEDTVVNVELTRRGHSAYREQTVRLIHNSPCRTPGKLVRHHFTRGRGLGRIMLAKERRRDRLLNRAVLANIGVRYVPRRLSRTAANVAMWGGELRPRWRRVYPLIVAGCVAAWAGTWYELLRPARGKGRALLARPRS